MADSTDATVVVGIPAYNEEGAVGDVVRQAREHASIVVVADDGSSDRTVSRAAAAGAEVVRHEENRGYGAALGTLFRTAAELDADHLVVVDADGQHDPADIPDLVETQRASGAEVVIGSRFLGDSETDAPLYRRFGLVVINSIVGAGLKFGYSVSRIRDTQSGFRAYDATAVRTLAERELSDGMDASIDILFQAADESFEFAEVPVEVTYDVEEANTHNPILHGAVLVRNAVSRIVLDRPGRSLGVTGTLCLLFGVALGGILGLDTPVTGLIPGVVATTLVLAGGSLIGAAVAVGGIAGTD